jgi:2'-5' RNA ligase
MVRFFLGIRLPKELEQECETLRRSFRAPKTVPHLTVCAPFLWERKPERLITVLEGCLRFTKPLEIHGTGIGSFGQRVLFINVHPSAELLDLAKQLTCTLRQAGVSVDTRPYHPHITLATRLSPAQYERYRGELGDFAPEYSFICSAVSLFRFTPEGRWHDWTRIQLGSLQPEQP